MSALHRAPQDPASGGGRRGRVGASPDKRSAGSFRNRRQGQGNASCPCLGEAHVTWPRRDSRLRSVLEDDLGTSDG